MSSGNKSSTIFTVSLILFSACAKPCNYLDYVSERRTQIYLYEDDSISIKIHCSEREQPFSADGCKGDMCKVAEVFVTLPDTPQEVEYVLHGGILQYVLRQRAVAAARG